MFKKIAGAVLILVLGLASWLGYTNYLKPPQKDVEVEGVKSPTSSWVRQLKPQCYYLTRDYPRGLEGVASYSIQPELQMGIVNQPQRVVADQEIVDAMSTRVINLDSHYYTYIDRTSPMYKWESISCSEEEVNAAIPAANALQTALGAKDYNNIKSTADPKKVAEAITKYIRKPVINYVQTPTCAYTVPVNRNGTQPEVPVLVLDAHPFIANGIDLPYYTQYKIADVKGYNPPQGIVEGLSQYSLKFVPCEFPNFNFKVAFKSVKCKDTGKLCVDVNTLKDNTELFAVPQLPPTPEAKSTSGVKSAPTQSPKPAPQPTRQDVQEEPDWIDWIIRVVEIVGGLGIVLLTLRLAGKWYRMRRSGPPSLSWGQQGPQQVPMPVPAAGPTQTAATSPPSGDMAPDWLEPADAHIFNLLVSAQSSGQQITGAVLQGYLNKKAKANADLQECEEQVKWLTDIGVLDKGRVVDSGIRTFVDACAAIYQAQKQPVV